MYVCMYVYMYVGRYVCVYVYQYVGFVCMYVCVYVGMYVCRSPSTGASISYTMAWNQPFPE